ncbi:hypothetical protein Q5752_004070 [Cryptotrichosporon argae]
MSSRERRGRTARHVNHVSRACDRCRRRRIRCDGLQPRCGTCDEKGWLCAYDEEDGRKTNSEMAELRARVNMLERKLQGHPPRVPGSASSLDVFPAIAGSISTAQTVRADRSPSSSLTSVPDEKPESYKEAQTLVVLGARRLGRAVLRVLRAVATLDVPSFLSGLTTHELDPRHGAYSLLLHCVVVWIGLRIRQSLTMDALDIPWGALEDHCAVLIRRETSRPSLNALRAVNLLSSSFNLEPEVGYVFFGLVNTMVQVVREVLAACHAACHAAYHNFADQHLCLNLDPDACVKRGEMTSAERDARSAAMWSMYLQDVLRAIAAGRPPILPELAGMPLPRIDAAVDAEPWVLPTYVSLFVSPRTAALSGLPALASTCLHWSAELGVILRCLLDTLYSPKSDSGRSLTPPSRLDPATHALHHVLVMHLTYHLITIYLHRPFYRTAAHPPSQSAAHCNDAASMMLDLLKLYDELHSVQLAPMTLVQIIFAGATIFLLRAASEQAVEVDASHSLDDMQQCHRLMGQLGNSR